MHKLRLFYVRSQNTQIFLLLLGNIKDHTKKQHKKVFSRSPVKRFFLYGSNKLASVPFGNAGFGEFKDHSLRTTGMCLPYVKRYFEEHQ